MKSDIMGRIVFVPLLFANFSDFFNQRLAQIFQVLNWERNKLKLRARLTLS